MEQSNIPFQGRAFVALHQLSASDQKAIHGALANLNMDRPGSWISEETRRLAPDWPVYVLPVGESLLLFLREKDDGRPEVDDIVRRELLESLRQAQVNGN